MRGRRRWKGRRRDGGRRRDEEDIKDSLEVEEGMIVKFPLGPVATFAAPASKFFQAKTS